jgi:hypothetical protein
MFAEPEHVEADAVGELDLSRTLAKLLSTSSGSAVVGSRRVSTNV